MVALVMFVFVFPVVLLITTIITATVMGLDALYDIGISLYNNRKPVNKYRQ